MKFAAVALIAVLLLVEGLLPPIALAGGLAAVLAALVYAERRRLAMRVA
jgi:ABC-type cobalamin transport system permease subunit